jgi:hypothetical protein
MKEEQRQVPALVEGGPNDFGLLQVRQSSSGCIELTIVQSNLEAFEAVVVRT